MARIASMMVGVACVLASAGGDAPPEASTPPPADFKIEVGEFGAVAKPVSTAQIVARGGRTYQFSSGSDEVVIVEPKRARVELLDLGRRLQAEIPFARLEESRARLKDALNSTIEKRQAKGGRSNVVLSQITRDLVEPRFRVEGDPKATRLRLVNRTVEVDAAGEPESDPARLALVALTLDATAKLGSFRVPSDLPPFSELDALAALAVDRKLRPTELSFLYRLAGPPVRIRRTYRLVPELTDREREAIARIETLREVAPVVRYERYAKVERPK